MDNEVIEALARLERMNQRMDELVETVKEQVANHVGEIKKSMAEYSFYLEQEY